MFKCCTSSTRCDVRLEEFGGEKVINYTFFFISCKRKNWKGDVLKKMYLNKEKVHSLKSFHSSLICWLPIFHNRVQKYSQGRFSVYHRVHTPFTHTLTPRGNLKSPNNLKWTFFCLWERSWEPGKNLQRHRGNIWTPPGPVPESNQEPSCLEITASLMICMLRSLLSSSWSYRLTFTQG